MPQQKNPPRLPLLTHCYCSFYLTGLFSRDSAAVFFKSNKEPLPLMVSRCHKSDAMTNWLFCLLFLFLCLMSFRQSFDPANLMDPHRKHLPPEDVFITRRLDARHLHGSTATDKLSLLPARAKRTTESLNKMLLNSFLTVWFCTLMGGYPFL